MNSLFASGHPFLNIIRRELEDLFDDLNMPRRMRHELERAFAQAPSPMWLWREVDHILEAFMSPPALRRRVEHTFDRVLSQRGLAMYNSNFGAPFSQYRNEFGPSFWRNDLDAFNAFNGFNTFNGQNHLQSRGAFGYDTFTPALELAETQSEYVVRVDLPGVRETDVETSITQDNVLVIRGERRDFGGARSSIFGNTWNTHARSIVGNPEYSEQNYGVFTRTVPLPRNINPLQIAAFFRDGVLEVRIAKFDSINTFNTFNAFNGARTRRVPVGRDDSRVAFGSTFGNSIWHGDQRAHVS